jgi:hypothetical protein
MALDVSLPQQWRTFTKSLTANNAALAQVLVDKTPPTGNLQGGARVIDGVVTSTDSVNKSILVWQGEELTTAANSGNLVFANTTAVTRNVGSFLVDGWRQGDRFMVVYGAQGQYTGTPGNYGNAWSIMSLSANNINVNGATFVQEIIEANARMVRVATRTRMLVTANSGNADSTPPVALMTGSQNPASAALPDTGWQLGPTSMLLISLANTTSVLPATVDVTCTAALY